jgi:hypothetical protein
VADRIGLSKSGVFSRIGSREALAEGRDRGIRPALHRDVFVPAMQQPKGLPRLDAIVQRWIVRTRDVEAAVGCIYTAGAFELDDREGELRDTLLGRSPAGARPCGAPCCRPWRPATCKPDTDAEQLVAEIYALSMGCCTMPVSCATPRGRTGPGHPGSACCEATRQRLTHNKETEKRGERAPRLSPDVLVTLISHDCAKKEEIMLILIIALGRVFGARAVTAALASLRGLPRSNEDWCLVLKNRNAKEPTP